MLVTAASGTAGYCSPEQAQAEAESKAGIPRERRELFQSK
jgi:hypothetical protein